MLIDQYLMFTNNVFVTKIYTLFIWFNGGIWDLTEKYIKSIV